MSISSKTIRRGGTLSRRIGNASQAAVRCVLFLFDERAISEAAASEAADVLFLLSCEVGDAIKTAVTERKLDERAELEESVSRETQANSITSEEDGDGQTTIPY